jgi:oligosaccharyl transferase (archaeosortase A-associated)
VIFAISLALRVIPMKDAVFGSGFVNMQGVDGVYHLRLVENLLAHFPFRISFDPYTFFPYGQDVFFAPLYDLLAGLCAWIIGLGSPDQHTIELVAAYFPAILGALVTIPVYFIGKAIFNRKAGLLGALIVGILPGTFLFRSRLGFFDHHVVEIFFSTLVVLFLVLALERVKQNPVSFDTLKNRDWKLLTKPLILAGLSGIALGLYLGAWVGGLLFVFILFCWAVLAFIISHLREESTDYIAILGIPLYILALLVTLPFLNQLALAQLIVISISMGIAAFVVLVFISRIMRSRNLKTFYYPLSIAGIGVIVLVIIFVFFPSLAHAIKDKFQVFTPGSASLTISEVQSIFVSQGSFSLARIWSEFNNAAIVAPIAFIMIVISVIKNVSQSKSLLLLWSLMVFLASAGQIRFAAYLAIACAILCGYFYNELVNWINNLFHWLFSKSSDNQKKTNHKKTRVKERVKSGVNKKANTRQDAPILQNSGLTRYKILAISISAILVFFAGIYPNLQPALKTAGTNTGITTDWRESLLWMKDNTPLPFGTDDFYYELYTKTEGKYIYPSSAYGVLAWWDYGHLITQIAHRVPNSNPTQAGADGAASYFLTQDESSANKKLDSQGSKYIIIDYDVAIPYKVMNNGITGNKFFALPTWIGKNQSEYADIYYQQKDNKLMPIPVYYPEYYYSLIARLYNFHGEAVIPNNSTTVISFALQSDRKVIQTNQTFASYELALTFFEKQTSPNYRIVGLSPFSSPVPLEKLSRYNEVFKSKSGIMYNSNKTGSSYIEIFEYK